MPVSTVVLRLLLAATECRANIKEDTPQAENDSTHTLQTPLSTNPHIYSTFTVNRWHFPDKLFHHWRASEDGGGGGNKTPHLSEAMANICTDSN